MVYSDGFGIRRVSKVNLSVLYSNLVLALGNLIPQIIEEEDGV